MKCPVCRTELPAKSTKEWNYKKNYYHVKSYKCPKCRKQTMEYYHDGKLSHTITPFQKKLNHAHSLV